ncbi:Glu/Leu/Phe/Val family dehydrogenase [Sporolactobacillus putidus]|uniref:Glutamate dehydrogenase n=1 Tax=Sporolactobacillus putidus TaxID=492735 RepID=A0A917RZ73_9BACL|nr:Glu/Leu/Phe/Val dehydrogenase [Sporolactobacillus putidus]GGL46979.1 glutamate dehydrogenase [Sporolactobacillus putidus]
MSVNQGSGSRSRDEKHHYLLRSVQAIVRHSLEELGYSEEMIELLKEPKCALEVKIPVRMDNGKIRIFTGYRVQHSDAIGPTKGGVLFHPDVSLTQVKALSVLNGIKSAILGLPCGGAKGGVICDPRELSFRELEGLSRGYIRAIRSIIGPRKDILALDVFTNTQIMAWMMDEYGRFSGTESPGFITGKPIVLGGLRGREYAVARSISRFVHEAASSKGIELNGAEAIIQGFGSAGSYVAKTLFESGARVVGISDAYGALYNPSGLDVEELLNCRDSFGTVTKLFQHTFTNQELLEKPCDILVLAAIENQITENNAADIRAKVVVEAAENAVSDQAAIILADRNILFVPEVLSCAADVTVSYFEWVQNNQGITWTEKEVEERLREVLSSAFEQVREMAGDRKTTMRTAAYLVGVQKLAESVRYRGWI